MPVKFIIVILCSFLVANCHLGGTKIKAVGTETSDFDLFAISLPGVEPSTGTHPLRRIFREEFYSEDRHEWECDLKKLNSQERSKISKNWVNNEAQVIALDEDWNELCTIDVILHHKKREVTAQSVTLEPQLSRAIEKCDKIMDKLDFLKQKRFLELSVGKKGLQNSHKNILASLVMQYTPNPLKRKRPSYSSDLPRISEVIDSKFLANAIVESLKRLIIDFKLFHENSHDEAVKAVLVLLRHGVLKRIDFLSKNQFADGDTIRSFAEIFTESPTATRTLIEQTGLFFPSLPLGADISKGSPYLTKRWYWRHLHEFFRVFRKEEKIAIEACLLLEIRHGNLLAKSPDGSHGDSPLWQDFHENFAEDEFAPLLQVIRDPQACQKISKNRKLQAWANEQVYKIIQLIGSHELDDSNMELQYHLRYILDFFETHISPGIIDRRTVRIRDFSLGKTFEKRDQLLELGSQLEDLLLQAKDFNFFITVQNEAGRQKVESYYISEFETLIDTTFKSTDQLRKFIDLVPVSDKSKDKIQNESQDNREDINEMIKRITNLINENPELKNILPIDQNEVKLRDIPSSNQHETESWV